MRQTPKLHFSPVVFLDAVTILTLLSYFTINHPKLYKSMLLYFIQNNLDYLNMEIHEFTGYLQFETQEGDFWEQEWNHRL